MARWYEISSDPNSPAAIADRRKTLDAAHRPPVVDRVGYLVEQAAGKRVLDVGVVDHTLDRRSPKWLHGRIVAAAKECIGVDVLPDAVEQLRREGYNVRLADVTQSPLEEQFEVIIAGELIEHLDRPGDLFRSAAAMLYPGGRLVLTTPNPYYLGRVKSFLRGKGGGSVDHVTFLYPSGIAELAERHGMRLDQYRGVQIRSTSSLSMLARVTVSSRWLLCRLGLSVDAFCEKYIYECVKPDNHPTPAAKGEVS